MNLILEGDLTLALEGDTSLVLEGGENLALELATSGLQGPPGIPGNGGGASYETTFTQSSLSIVGVLALTHNLNSYPSGMQIYNASGELVIPDKIEVLTLNTLAIYLESFIPLSGTWQLSVTQ